MEVPVADVEIDVDIEYDLDNRVYMWGARLRRGTDDCHRTVLRRIRRVGPP